MIISNWVLAVQLLAKTSISINWQILLRLAQLVDEHADADTNTLNEINNLLVLAVDRLKQENNNHE